MEEKRFLKVTDLFILGEPIQETKVINDKLYIADSSNLYVLNKAIEHIDKKQVFFLDALEDKDKQLTLMSLNKARDKVTYKSGKNIKYEVDLSLKAKKLFLFYTKGYGVVLLENNSIDIYSTKFNKIITNIKLLDDITHIFKSFISNKLLFIAKNKISFFDIETYNISKYVDIEDSSYIDISIIKDTIYLIYQDKIRIIEKDNTQTDIKIDVDETIVRVFTNIYQNEIIFTTKDNSIYLYHPVSNSIFKVLKHKAPIQEVRFIDSDIFLISENKILKIDTTQGALEFEKHLVLEEANEALTILEENPFLILDEMFFQSLCKLWVDRYNKISNKLLMNKIDEAKEIFSKFETFYTYKKEFEDIMKLSDILLLLSHSLRTINYNKAFELIEQNPPLKQTPIGKKLLDDWEQNFEKFILSLLKNSFDNQSQEYRSLQKYFNVESKKHLILFSIENQTVILSAVQAFKNKKYSLYIKLLEKYTFLNELPITKKIHALSNNIYLKVLKHIQRNELNQSLPALETLQNFTYYKSDAMLLKEKVNVFLGFEASFEKSNFERCRMFLEQYNEHFHDTSYYFNIMLIDTKKIDSSIVFIGNNDFEKAYLILQEFFKSQIWASKIKHLMVRYYVEQFQSKEKEFSIESQKKFIGKFYDLFGYIDDSFPNICDEYTYKDIETKEHIMNYPKILL